MTAEHESQGSLDYSNMSSDVIVEIEDEDSHLIESYVAPFYSCSHLENLLRDYKEEKEYHDGRAYMMLNEVLVRDLQKDNLRAIIERMVEEGDFQLVFKKI